MSHAYATHDQDYLDFRPPTEDEYKMRLEQKALEKRLQELSIPTKYIFTKSKANDRYNRTSAFTPVNQSDGKAVFELSTVMKYLPYIIVYTPLIYYFGFHRFMIAEPEDDVLSTIFTSLLSRPHGESDAEPDSDDDHDDDSNADGDEYNGLNDDDVRRMRIELNRRSREKRQQLDDYDDDDDLSIDSDDWEKHLLLSDSDDSSEENDSNSDEPGVAEAIMRTIQGKPLRKPRQTVKPPKKPKSKRGNKQLPSTASENDEGLGGDVDVKSNSNVMQLGRGDDSESEDEDEDDDEDEDSDSDEDTYDDDIDSNDNSSEDSDSIQRILSKPQPLFGGLDHVGIDDVGAVHGDNDDNKKDDHEEDEEDDHIDNHSGNSNSNITEKPSQHSNSNSKKIDDSDNDDDDGDGDEHVDEDDEFNRYHIDYIPVNDDPDDLSIFYTILDGQSLPSPNTTTTTTPTSTSTSSATPPQS